jgi:hypothetical protein
VLVSRLFNGTEGIETGGASEDQDKISGRGTGFDGDSKGKVSRYGKVLKKKA